MVCELRVGLSFCDHFRRCCLVHFWWRQHCRLLHWNAVLPAWFKLESQDFAHPALNFDISAFCQEPKHSLQVLEVNPGILKFISMKAPALQRARGAIQLYRGVVWGKNNLPDSRIQGRRGRCVGPELQWKQYKEVNFSCSMSLTGGVCAWPPSRCRQSLCSPSRWLCTVAAEDVPPSVTGCQPEPTQLISKWQ